MPSSMLPLLGRYTTFLLLAIVSAMSFAACDPDAAGQKAKHSSPSRVTADIVDDKMPRAAWQRLAHQEWRVCIA